MKGTWAFLLRPTAASRNLSQASLPELLKLKVKSQEEFDRGKDAFEDGADLQYYRTYCVAYSFNWCLLSARCKDAEGRKADAVPVLVKFTFWREKWSCCTSLT